MILAKTCIDGFSQIIIHKRVLQVESVVLLFVDEANTVSKELNQWRATLSDHERQFHNWKKIWVGVRTARYS